MCITVMCDYLSIPMQYGAWRRSHLYIRVHTNTHTHTHTHTCTHTRARTHSRSHTHMLKHTQAHTHAHTERERESHRYTTDLHLVKPSLNGSLAIPLLCLSVFLAVCVSAAPLFCTG